ncbi:type I-E CRISPR-associated protein Cse2/CasB [Suicoccus acidiformans]|uniref:Type I-E CRISPR-associated protein Cse2/CasB n=1 Tax=Suicoccus acidiformans TaxID=2036206 RepID=A0A347WJQ1_9LACT|nr:type I-E CRISPR-associated protein Cse2/CasB [Suicoccus acidiformans]AXY25308.1 type I-E CRISPR-associated protein Cse2/CasB [Suicoccus acidiformans]
MSENLDIYLIVSRILRRIESNLETSSGKAILANLRHSVGRPISESVEIWPLVFEEIPEHYLSNRGELTKEERAIISTLQLYAIHQQSKPLSVNSYDKSDSVGKALKALRQEDNQVAIDRRFNTMITASTYEELIHHLRQLIRLLRNKAPQQRLNYASLANDLYWFQRGYEESIRLRWGKAYYRGQQVKEDKGED